MKTKHQKKKALQKILDKRITSVVNCISSLSRDDIPEFSAFVSTDFEWSKKDLIVKLGNIEYRLKMTMIPSFDRKEPEYEKHVKEFTKAQKKLDEEYGSGDHDYGIPFLYFRSIVEEISKTVGNINHNNIVIGHHAEAGYGCPCCGDDSPESTILIRIRNIDLDKIDFEDANNG